jgi:hypothetical protein
MRWLLAMTPAIALAACADLFHSTSEILNACELDATACADAQREPDAPRPPADFCKWTPSEALARAKDACAWLSACQRPLGGNKVGTCMARALLAYDCAANPNRRVKGRAHELWDCLSQAKSCDAVAACVFPVGTPSCEDDAGNFAGCGTGANRAARLECAPGRPKALGESCAAAGQICVNATCTTEGACAASGCAGTVLKQCDAGVSLGLDCESFGGQRCVEAEAGAPSCLAERGDSCTPTVDIACLDGGRASACPSGVRETVDCNVLTGSGTCNQAKVTPQLGAAAGCYAGNGNCPADTCSGDVVVSCFAGRTWELRCAEHGLGPCRDAPTIDDPNAKSCTPR